MKLKDLERQYQEQAEKRKNKIRQEPKKSKRFWMWIWYGICFPWVWLFYKIRDWRSLICVIISFILWSSSVWGVFLASVLCGFTATTAGKTLLGIATMIWAWWLSPMGSPFIILVTFTAMGLKMLFDAFKKWRRKKHRHQEINEDSTINEEVIKKDKQDTNNDSL